MDLRSTGAISARGPHVFTRLAARALSFRDKSKENTMSRFSMITAVATPLLIAASFVQAEPVKFEALVATKETIRLDFADARSIFSRWSGARASPKGKAHSQGLRSKNTEPTTSCPESAGADIWNSLRRM